MKQFTVRAIYIGQFRERLINAFFFFFFWSDILIFSILLIVIFLMTGRKKMRKFHACIEAVFKQMQSQLIRIFVWKILYWIRRWTKWFIIKWLLYVFILCVEQLFTGHRLNFHFIQCDLHQLQKKECSAYSSTENNGWFASNAAKTASFIFSPIIHWLSANNYYCIMWW